VSALGETIRWWGTTPGERAEALGCDALVPDGIRLARAVDVAAPAEVVFRWLCQLRAAPYSYDLLDNFGRRSPQVLVAGLERLEVGQPFMTIFRLRAFEPGRSVTLEHRGRAFGHVAVTYLVTPAGPQDSRLRQRIAWTPPRVPFGRRALTAALAAGDLVMTRRQLLNLKGLAERDR